jgi:hypothetical protein
MEPWYSRPWLLVVSLLLLTICAYYCVKYIWYTPAIDLKDKGPLGDVFNGLLTPFISFFSALLIYISFKEQIRANKLIQAQWLFDRNLDILKTIKQDFNSIASGDPINSAIRGKIAVNMLANTVGTEVRDYLQEYRKLESILIELQFLIERVKQTDVESQRYIWLKLDLFYVENLEESLGVFRLGFSRHNYAGLLTDLKSEMNKFAELYKARMRL